MACSRGLLYHDQQTVFGEALIESFPLESMVSQYPRIMLTSHVVKDAIGSNLKQYFVDHIRQGDDGPFYVHVLSKMRMMLDILKRDGARQNYRLSCHTIKLWANRFRNDFWSLSTLHRTLRSGSRLQTIET